jgi:hypothetical protein
MNVSEYMTRRGLTESDLDQMAAPYETGEFPSEEGVVHTGSHVDAVGKRRVTVLYDARDTQRVATIARNRGVTPSVIYRDALDYYLAAQA